MVIFTEEELKSLKKKQLYDLALYYDLPVYKSWKKKDILQSLLDYLFPEVKEEDGLPQMSVRVKRIYNSSRR